jgi:hypothetical protein
VKEVLIIIQKRTEMLWLLPWCWQHAAWPAFRQTSSHRYF